MELKIMENGWYREATPEEEAEILSFWEKGKAKSKLPKPPTIEEKFNWLLEGGAELVSLKMSEHEASKAEVMAEVNIAKLNHQEKYKAYIESQNIKRG